MRRAGSTRTVRRPAKIVITAEPCEMIPPMRTSHQHALSYDRRRGHCPEISGRLSVFAVRRRSPRPASKSPQRLLRWSAARLILRS